MTLRRGFAAFLLFVLPCLLAAAPPAAAREVTASQGNIIQIEINKGVLVRLDRPAATVFVADPEIADIQVKSPSLIYVLAKKVGETTLFAVDGRERVLLDTPVTVTHDLSRLNIALRSLLPGADVTARSVDGAVILTGAVEKPVEAEDARRLSEKFIGEDDEIINRLSVVGPNQVNLRVRVAEVSRDALKELGFNWENVFSVGGFIGALAIGNPVLAAGGGFLRAPDPQLDNIGLSYTSGNVSINTVIDALADEGLVSILAEPNLTAVSGQSANFLAGGEFPIPIAQSTSGTNTAITVEFKQFGVSLDFTPTVLSDDLISLKVIPEVSQLTETGSVELEGFSIPALTTRRAETTVELGSGQSFAIAGLFQNDTAHTMSKFPGLGDLPILGPLFRSSRFRRQETELVIIVTPYIVRPVSTQLAAPTDGLVAPSDRERIFLGEAYRPQLQGNPRPAHRPGGKGLQGPVGFMLDQ